MSLSEKDIEMSMVAVQKHVNQKYFYLQKADKDDLVQNTMEKFIKSYRDRFIQMGVKATTLANRICDNLFIDRYKKEQKGMKHNVSLDNLISQGTAVPLGTWDYPEETINDVLINIRWGGFPISPWSPNGKVYQYGNGKYRCADTQRYFNVRTNTIFGYTKMAWKVWIIIMSEFIHGESRSEVVAQKANITVKSAWGAIYRLKQVTIDKDPTKMTLQQLFETAFDYPIDKDIIVPPLEKHSNVKRIRETCRNKADVITSNVTTEKPKEVKPMVLEKKKTMEKQDDVLQKIQGLLRYCIENNMPLPIEYVNKYNEMVNFSKDNENEKQL